MKIEFDEVCKSCKGTGLYIGMAERDGAAIVCQTCKGTGCHHFTYEYEKFEGRKYRAGVKRVFQTNPGIILGEGKDFSLSDFGGLSINDWLYGKEFLPGSENRKFTCPAWWYQSANYRKKPEWVECYSSLGCTFSRCHYFPTKYLCWERYDTETSNVKV